MTLNMRTSVLLAVTSLISIVLFMLHLADDIAHGFEAGVVKDLIGGTAITGVWLYGTLMLQGRLAGYIITLIGGVFSFGVAALHMSGKGVGEIAKASGGFFFVTTLLALGLTGAFAFILSIHGFWGLIRGKSQNGV